MNESTQSTHDHEEWRDRAIDQGLREVVGGESPPDLSERILAVAESPATMSLAPSGDDEMSTQPLQTRSSARFWGISLAAAASLLVAAGLLWPSVLASRDAARRSPTDNDLGRTPSTDRLDKQSSVSTSEVIQGEESGVSLEVQDDKAADSLMMMVTPRIIAGEESESVVAKDLDIAPDPSAQLGFQSTTVGQAPDELLLRGTEAGKPSQSPPATWWGHAQDAYERKWTSGEVGGGGQSATPHLKGQVPTDSLESVAAPDDGVQNSIAGGSVVSGESNQSGAGGERGGYGGRIATENGYGMDGGRGGGYGGRGSYGRGRVDGRGGVLGGSRVASPQSVDELVAGEPMSGVQSSDVRSDNVSDLYGASEPAAASRSASDGASVGVRFRQNSSERPLDGLAADADVPARPDSYGLNGPMVAKNLSVAGDAKREQIVELDIRYRGRRDSVDFMLESGEAKLTPGIVIAHDPSEERLIGHGESQIFRTHIEPQRGIGPGESGDKYERIVDNPFKTTAEEILSTFSIDVDTASYANVRQFLLQSGQLPPADAVRVEELINYFNYDYSGPTDDTPFAAHLEVAACPWESEHRLVRIGVKGRELLRDSRPLSNLVFLIDVSGSMNEPAKLPLLVEGMKMLTRELGENDRVAIVVYASSEGLALDSTLGTDQNTILAALDRLRAGGSTAGGAGIQLAYQMTEKHFVEGGVNRVILCTDGDFNVGVTSPAELERMAEEKAKATGVALTVLGFGRGNLNDQMMEKISGKGNGNYYYIDNRTEAEKVLVAEMAGTLVTIAKDVKFQVDFNPAQVAGYRLIGYANRLLDKEDFNDDTKDAGEIGAGHTVTALYEIVPAGKEVGSGDVDQSKYVSAAGLTPEAAASEELLTVRVRYKQPDGDVSKYLEFPLTDNGQEFASASDEFRFASAVASFGMLLRKSQYAGDASLAGVEEIAGNSIGERDEHGYRAEFLTLVKRARELRGE